MEEVQWCSVAQGLQLVVVMSSFSNALCSGWKKWQGPLGLVGMVERKARKGREARCQCAQLWVGHRRRTWRTSTSQSVAVNMGLF